MLLVLLMFHDYGPGPSVIYGGRLFPWSHPIIALWMPLRQCWKQKPFPGMLARLCGWSYHVSRGLRSGGLWLGTNETSPRMWETGAPGKEDHLKRREEKSGCKLSKKTLRPPEGVLCDDSGQWV